MGYAEQQAGGERQGAQVAPCRACEVAKTGVLGPDNVLWAAGIDDSPGFMAPLPCLSIGRRSTLRWPRVSRICRRSDVMGITTRGWSDLGEAAGGGLALPGPHEVVLRRAVGRLLHLDDDVRSSGYRLLLAAGAVDGAPRVTLFDETGQHRRGQ